MTWKAWEFLATTAVVAMLPWLDRIYGFLLWNASTVSFRCSLVSNGVFWVASLLGLWADHRVHTQQSPWLTRNKLRPKIIISGRDRIDLIQLAFFNMVVVALFVCCPLGEWVWTKRWANHRLTPGDEFDWRSEAPKIPIHALVAELAFYTVHGLLHWSSFLYQHVHRVHHRFPAPTAMACVYAHPLEFALGNVLPIYLGPMLVTNAHPYTCYAWWGLAMLGTCKGHSGYRILGHADDHEEHHALFRYHYGGMGLLDRLFGTTPPAKPPTEMARTVT